MNAAPLEEDGFLGTIISKLGTCFATPEEEVIKQDESGNDMYFLSKGDCAVNIKDETGELHVAVGLLTEGDHFGEISMIYHSKRTATVVSRNYNTMARISYQKFRAVTNQFPIYQKLLSQHSHSYHDVKTLFLRKIIHGVFYF
jgi:CRP-like cAMP-binding protein